MKPLARLFLLFIFIPSLIFGFDLNSPYLAYATGPGKFYLQGGVLHVLQNASLAAEPNNILSNVKVYQPPFLISGTQVYYMKTFLNSNRLPGNLGIQAIRLGTSNNVRPIWVTPAGYLKYFENGSVRAAGIQVFQNGKVKIHGVNGLDRDGLVQLGNHLVARDLLNYDHERVSTRLYWVNGRAQDLKGTQNLVNLSGSDVVWMNSESGAKTLLQFDAATKKLVEVERAPDMPIRQVSGSTILFESGIVYHIIRMKFDDPPPREFRFIAMKVDLGDAVAEEVFESGEDIFVLTRNAIHPLRHDGVDTAAYEETLLRVRKPYSSVSDPQTGGRMLVTESRSSWIAPGALRNVDRKRSVLPRLFFEDLPCRTILRKLTTQ